jgi:predicted RNA-binding Zn ribbon-like protein/Fe-S cluster assembly iron-binding protein IscA
MRTIQRPKKQNQWFFISAAQILSLLIVFGIGGCRGCGLQSENGTSINLTMTLSKNSIVDHEKFIVNIKNEAEKISGEEVANEVSSNQAKLMVKFSTGGTGSKFVYDDETGNRVEESEISRPLDEFKGNATIAAQETKNIEIGVIPGPGVTSAEIEITLVTIKEDKETVETEKVTWTATSVAELKLIPIVDAIDNDPGKFAIKVGKDDIKPSDIQVSWTSEHGTVFNFAGKFIGANPTLKDLLGNDDVIKAGTQSAEINYTLAGVPPAFNILTITLSLKKGSQVLLASTANQLTWNAKDLDLKLNVTVVGKTISYKITKKPGVEIDDTNDKIELVYEKTEASNAATLARTGAGTENTTGTVLLQQGDFSASDEVEGKLAVDLKTEKSVKVKFTLKYNDTTLATKTAEVKKDIQLSIGSIEHNRIDNKVLVKIKNNGVDGAKGVKLTYATTTMATIDGKKTAFKENLALAGSSQVDIELGLLDFQGEKSAEFIFTLEDNATKVADKSQTFTKKNLEITLSAGPYGPEKGFVEVEINNTGQDAVEGVDNLVLDYSLDNGAQFDSGSDKGIQSIADLKGTDGKIKGALKINLKGQASSTLTLQLKLDGKKLGAAVTVVCKEDVQLMPGLDDTSLNRIGNLAVDYVVTNNGANLAAKEKLQVKLIRKKGLNSTINGVNPGRAINAQQLIAAIADVGMRATENIVTLTLDPKGDTEVEIGVQLVYRGMDVEDVKTITWENRQEPQLTIIDLVKTDLEGAEKTFKYKLVNTGTGKAEKAKRKLKVTNNSDKAIKISWAIINPNDSAELIDSDIVGAGDITENKGDSGDLKLTIDPQGNAEVFLDLEPIYGSTSQGDVKSVTWKAAPVLEPKIEMNGEAKNFKNQPAKITLTNKTGRALKVIELKVVQLSLTASAGLSIDDINGGINGKSLEALDKAGKPVAKDGKIELDVTLRRTDNLPKVISNMQVVAGSVPLMDIWFTFTRLNWPASVLKFESRVEIVGAATSFREQPAKIILTNKSGRMLTLAELKVLTLDYPQHVLAAKLQVNNVDCKDKDLNYLVDSLAELAEDGEIAFEVTLVRDVNKQVGIPIPKVMAGTTIVTQDVKLIKWEAVPIITLTSDKSIAYTSGEKEMKLTLKTNKDIAEELAKEIKVKVTATGGGALKLKGGADINGLSLFELLGSKGVNMAVGADIDIEFTVVSDNVFEISLEGPIELKTKFKVVKKA